MNRVFSERRSVQGLAKITAAWATLFFSSEMGRNFLLPGDPQLHFSKQKSRFDNRFKMIIYDFADKPAVPLALALPLRCLWLSPEVPDFIRR